VQIHHAKKAPTEAGYARFNTEKNERRHADKFRGIVRLISLALLRGAINIGQ